jgi:hypothetical protein
MWKRFNFLAAYTLLVLVTVGCSKLGTSLFPSAAKATTVSGRVFLITMGGDLRPARMARIYIRDSRTKLDIESLNTDQEIAVSECEAAKRMRPLGLDNIVRSSIEIYKSHLDEMEKLFAADVDQKTSRSIKADEEGRFAIRDLPRGTFVIAAFGRAGVNLGYWSEELQIQNADQLEVKLSEPKVACSII